jgi:PPOX class probable F420-dependent enzyme
MPPGIQQTLEQARLLYLTTYNTRGQAGTVPIWFFLHQETICFCTRRDSLKVHRLRQTGRATVHIGSATGPRLDCSAHLVENDTALRRLLLRAYRRRYRWYWLFMGPRLAWAFARGQEIIVQLRCLT